jgi:hypothetical protein
MPIAVNDFRRIFGSLGMPIIRCYIKRHEIQKIPLLFAHASINVDYDEKYWSKLWALDYKGVIRVGTSLIRVSARPIDDNSDVVSFGLPPIWRPILCTRRLVITYRAKRALRPIMSGRSGEMADIRH